jgi:hypothetical protein
MLQRRAISTMEQALSSVILKSKKVTLALTLNSKLE